MKALVRGMTARIAIGLSFHLTHPQVLQRLMTLSRSHDLELYLSAVGDDEPFHPKVYAFDREIGSTVIVGPANLTTGGFASNYEASILVNGDADPSRQPDSIRNNSHGAVWPYAVHLRDY